MSDPVADVADILHDLQLAVERETAEMAQSESTDSQVGPGNGLDDIVEDFMDLVEQFDDLVAVIEPVDSTPDGPTSFSMEAEEEMEEEDGEYLPEQLTAVEVQGQGVRVDIEEHIFANLVTSESRGHQKKKKGLTLLTSNKDECLYDPTLWGAALAELHTLRDGEWLDFHFLDYWLERTSRKLEGHNFQYIPSRLLSREGYEWRPNDGEILAF